MLHRTYFSPHRRGARQALAAPDLRLRKRAAETIDAILIAKLSPAEGDMADDHQLVLPTA